MIEFAFFVTSEIVFFFFYYRREEMTMSYLTQLLQMATQPYNEAWFRRDVVGF